MLFDVIELGARLEGIVVPVQLPHPTVENETSNILKRWKTPHRLMLGYP